MDNKKAIRAFMDAYICSNPGFRESFEAGLLAAAPYLQADPAPTRSMSGTMADEARVRFPTDKTDAWEARQDAEKQPKPDGNVVESAECFLARVGYADSRVHSAPAIAKLMEDYAAVAREGWVPVSERNDWLKLAQSNAHEATELKQQLADSETEHKFAVDSFLREIAEYKQQLKDEALALPPRSSPAEEQGGDEAVIRAFRVESVIESGAQLKRIAALEAALAEAKATIARLSAPVSDSEWDNSCANFYDGTDHDYDEEAMTRRSVDGMIEDRVGLLPAPPSAKESK